MRERGIYRERSEQCKYAYVWCMGTVESTSIGKQSQNPDIFGNLEIKARTCQGEKRTYSHSTFLLTKFLYAMEQQFVLSSGKLINAVNSTHMGRCTVYVHRDTYELIAANFLSHYVFLNKIKK